MKTTIVICFMLLFGSALFSIKYAMALEMSDFLPRFLASKKNQGNNQNIEQDRKLNANQNTNDINSIEASKESSEYCPNTHDTHVASDVISKDRVLDDQIDLSNSLRVKDNNPDSVVNHSKNSTNTNQSSDITNASSGWVSIKTDSNQAALQDSLTKNALEKYQGAFLLPIQPQKDVKMNISDKQIQVNIKY